MAALAQKGASRQDTADEADFCAGSLYIAANKKPPDVSDGLIKCFTLNKSASPS